MSFTQGKLSVVVIDDNYILRQTLITSISHLSGLNKSQIEFMTSSNGLEGLGLTIAADPDVVILDSTLPRYSGRELIEFLISNPSLKNKQTVVIVLVEKGVKLDLPKNYVVVERDDLQFLKKVLDGVLLSKKFSRSTNTESKLLLSLSAKLIQLTTKSDNLVKSASYATAFSRALIYGWWLISQLYLNLLLSILFICWGKVKEANVDQKLLDLAEYRIRYYPTVVTSFLAFFLIILQIAAYVAGSLVLFGVKVRSVFANQSPTVEINLWDSIYDKSKITLTEKGELQLVGCDIDNFQPMKASGVMVIGEGHREKYGVVESIKAQSNVTKTGSAGKTCFSADSPSVTFNEPIDYTDLLGLLEESSINDFNKSLEVNSPKESREKPAFISYQLSPDSRKWYFCDDGKWSLTEAQSVRSNTVQELNKCIDFYNSAAGGDTVYLKAFFNSDGKTALSLKQITVRRRLSYVYLAKKQDIAEDKEVRYLFDEEVKVSITNAIPKNQNLLLIGKIDIYDNGLIRDKDRSFEVELYSLKSQNDLYTNGRLIGKGKPLPINESNGLELNYSLVTKVPSDKYIFAKATASDGNVVNSQIVALNTIAVTTTTDGSDYNVGDGYCDIDAEIPGPQCSLRSAIEELNKLNLKHSIINFSISLSDPGYVDYDNSDKAGTGDVLDGDDYWLIKPESQIPSITVPNVIIDGNSQELNQGNRNLVGPEIVINGKDLKDSSGLRFAFSAKNSLINELTINGFRRGNGTNRYGLMVFSNGFRLTSSFLGTDPLGESLDENNYDILISAAQNVEIGTSIETGNTIGSQNGIHVICSSKTPITFRGNLFGLNAKGDRSLSSLGNAIYTEGDCSLNLKENFGLNK